MRGWGWVSNVHTNHNRMTEWKENKIKCSNAHLDAFTLVPSSIKSFTTKSPVPIDAACNGKTPSSPELIG
ncbi:hypothetical protein PILCRDRAFT_621231 [Piloderma croceum F 1598]|uniref:Uncharacterized protein n=1 Tax=Piloderma croceum (strain F 1598) TaxID=765440 RepID=A0A0C3EY69_PILCF|nr:hypothetical protein PILCRDRAFT_621231 [Piloderma croceum F 1598]